MKRVFLLTAVMIIASTWARPARAQLGILNLGTNTGISNQLDRQKNLVNKKQTNALPPPPVASSTRAHFSHPTKANSSAADRFGRQDLVGHSVSGYPVIRGELNGSGAVHVSRGGANGQGGKVIRHK